MPSLTRKLINGRPYYYARWCQRVDGRPKIVRTFYLGSLDNIVQAVETAQQPLPPREAEVAHFAEIVALYDQATQLGLVELIDAQIPKRHQGLSVGQYLVLAAINRAAHPTSKAKLVQWYRHTVLPRLMPARADELTSQAFWNHMDQVSQGDIEAIEKNLAQRLLRDLKLDLRTLVYDGTNFFTYINTTNPATLPARGHNKQKRGDLRQVNLGMLVSTDFHVPLLHRVYTGNVTDATAFQSISEELARHYQQLAEGCEHITLIFDKGNNSAEAFESVDDSIFHFVGSLVPTQHPELLRIPLEQFRPLPGARFEGVSVYRTRKVVFGQERTIVITFNESLLEGQLQGITANLERARRKLSDLQDKLRRHRQGRVKGGRAPKAESVRKQVEQILSGQFLKQLIHCEVEAQKVPSLRFRSNTGALARLIDTQLGQDRLVHRQRRLVGPRDCFGLPGPIPHRKRVPGYEEPAFPGLVTDVSLDRQQDPRACLLLRSGFDAGLVVAADSSLQGNRPEPHPHDGTAGHHSGSPGHLSAPTRPAQTAHRRLPFASR